MKTWAAYGMLRSHAYTAKPECPYEPPGKDAPRKAQGLKLSQRKPIMPECPKEVQCEA